MPKYPYNSIFNITQELANSPAFKMAQELANSPAFKMAQELANSPSVKMAQELANNPAFKMAQNIEQFSTAFNPVFSAIDNIRISPDYIEIPAELIPENLFSEAISPESVPVNTPIKKLSRDQALVIIGLLLNIMFWILNNTSPAPWQQKYYDEISQSLEKRNNLLEESNEIQKKQNDLLEEFNEIQKKQNDLLEESNQIQAERAQLEKEQLQATEEQTQVLKAIDHLLGIQDSLLSQETVAPSESPDTDLKETDVDSGSLAADPKAATAEAESFPADEPHPIPD